jgi:DNA-binding CsgD family transcriptional regulator
LTSSSIAIARLSKDGSIITLDSAGLKVLDDGDIIFAKNNKLAGVGSTNFTRLDRALEAGTSSRILLTSTQGNDPVCIELNPSNEGWLLLFKRADTVPVIELSSVADQFDLTNKEARVLSLLLSGRSEAEVAEELGVSLETIRTHRKAIYGKMNVTTRVDLVLVMWRLFGL